MDAEWEQGVEAGNANFIRFPEDKAYGEYLLEFSGEPHKVTKKWGPAWEVDVLDLTAEAEERQSILPLNATRLRHALKLYRAQKDSSGLQGLRCKVTFTGKGFKRLFIVDDISREDLPNITDKALVKQLKESIQ